MVEIKLCKCAHFEDVHYEDGCIDCGYEYNKYGEMKSKKDGTTCKKFNPIYNAELMEIENVDMYIEDHGILTLFINLKTNGTVQGYGGFSLDEYNKEKDCREGTAFGITLIRRLLDWFEVTKLDDIGGKLVWALRTEHSGLIVGLKREDTKKKPKDNNHIFSIKAIANEYFPEDKS